MPFWPIDGFRKRFASGYLNRKHIWWRKFTTITRRIDQTPFSFFHFSPVDTTEATGSIRTSEALNTHSAKRGKHTFLDVAGASWAECRAEGGGNLKNIKSERPVARQSAPDGQTIDRRRHRLRRRCKCRSGYQHVQRARGPGSQEKNTRRTASSFYESHFSIATLSPNHPRSLLLRLFFLVIEFSRNRTFRSFGTLTNVVSRSSLRVSIIRQVFPDEYTRSTLSQKLSILLHREAD